MNKRIKKIAQIVIFAFIFGIFCFSSNYIVKADSGIVCQPVTVEICSICGGDYSTCPHSRDETYNQTVCEPIEQGICTICGEAFESCPHSYGAVYGGTECTTYDRCNICGNNYNDGSVCSHRRGEGYGGDICYTYTIRICNLCGNNYDDPNVCPHVEGIDDCGPNNIRICSICGNNYDDGNVCSHMEGSAYNQAICATTEICCICGGDYSSCPHQKGTIYGGSTCTYYNGRICNICGRNYDDGNVCPHIQGEGYGGTVCTTRPTRICNVCGNNYDNVRLCYHVSQNLYSDEQNNIEDPTWNEIAMSVYKGTPLYKWFHGVTQNGEYSNVFDLAGFERDQNGVYHAQQDALQQYGGYTDFYDMVFDLATSMDKRKFSFIVNGQERIIWLWKGDYLNLGAGAEIGIYYGGEPFWQCGTTYAMPMTLTMVDHSGNVIFDWNPNCNNWWCTGFNPAYQNMDKSNLTVYGSVNFSQDLDMWNSFYSEYNDSATWTFDEQQHKAYFKW